MRLLWLLLLVPVVQGFALEDATGDVTVDHCQAARSPAIGFEAMDLTGLAINETPQDLVFTVTTAGMEEEAGPDSGNYFVHFRRGDYHYAVRMFQDNQGSGAVAHLLQTEGPSIFGPVIAQFTASVDGQGITTAVPRDWLIDHDGAAPIRGHAMDDIFVSAQAHATGIYACSFDGSDGGPAIVQDDMPDDRNGGSMVFAYGGGASEGAVELTVERPFRASNGEATTYRFNATVRNLGDAPHAYRLSTGPLPLQWHLVHPNGTLQLDPEQAATFEVFLTVPFRHQHGTTQQFDLLVEERDGAARAWAQVGVHYLAVPQPAGHHSKVFIHSLTSMGPFSAFSAAAGGGDHAMYWNTLDEDEADHGVAMSSQNVEGVHTWYGCLAPRLALGLRPDNITGAFELEFASDFDVSGELSGTIWLVHEERGATCHDARNWAPGQPIVHLDPVVVSGGMATGTTTVAFDQDIPFSGGDLLLELRLVSDQQMLLGGTIDLLPGGWMQLPLQDHHDAAPDMQPPRAGEAFVEEPGPMTKDSPAPLVLLVAGLLWACRRR